jgi:hypothetical protein
MTRKFFTKKSLIRKCLICKGPNPVRQNDHMYCEVCLTKRCCVCGKIKLFQVRLVEIEGTEQAICPRHYGSYQRFRSASLNPHWLADREFDLFIDRLRMDKLQREAERKMENGEIVPNQAISDAELMRKLDEELERKFNSKE